MSSLRLYLIVIGNCYSLWQPLTFQTIFICIKRQPHSTIEGRLIERKNEWLINSSNKSNWQHIIIGCYGILHQDSYRQNTNKINLRWGYSIHWVDKEDYRFVCWILACWLVKSVNTTFKLAIKTKMWLRCKRRIRISSERTKTENISNVYILAEGFEKP